MLAYNPPNFHSPALNLFPAKTMQFTPSGQKKNGVVCHKVTRFFSNRKFSPETMRNKTRQSGKIIATSDWNNNKKLYIYGTFPTIGQPVFANLTIPVPHAQRLQPPIPRRTACPAGKIRNRKPPVEIVAGLSLARIRPRPAAHDPNNTRRNCRRGQSVHLRFLRHAARNPDRDQCAEQRPRRTDTVRTRKHRTAHPPG